MTRTTSTETRERNRKFVVWSGGSSDRSQDDSLERRHRLWQDRLGGCVVNAPYS